MLLTGESVHETQLMTPKGIELHLSTENAEISEACASCAVRKDSGDDPDITNGILVYAKAEKIPFGIEIDGGKGIGRVTKAGLPRGKGHMPGYPFRSPCIYLRKPDLFFLCL